MKEKYGSDAEEDEEEEDSEDLESEDEDGEELTPAVDAAILRTLARIKRRDPAIYEQGKDVFDGVSRFYLLLREPDSVPIYNLQRRSTRLATSRLQRVGRGTKYACYPTRSVHYSRRFSVKTYHHQTTSPSSCARRRLPLSIP